MRRVRIRLLKGLNSFHNGQAMVFFPMKIRGSRSVWIVAALLMGIGGVALDKLFVSPGVTGRTETTMLALYLPTPASIVEKGLTMAKVGPADTVYDLGSGDGRVLIMAAQKFGARAVGIELNYGLVIQSRSAIQGLGLESKIDVRWDDILDQDLSPATVVFLYLPQEANEALRPKLEHELRPQTRVISHNAPVPDWEPMAVLPIPNPAGVGDHHTLYLYIR